MNLVKEIIKKKQKGVGEVKPLLLECLGKILSYGVAQSQKTQILEAGQPPSGLCHSHVIFAVFKGMLPPKASADSERELGSTFFLVLD